MKSSVFPFVRLENVRQTVLDTETYSGFLLTVVSGGYLLLSTT